MKRIAIFLLFLLTISTFGGCAGSDAALNGFEERFSTVVSNAESKVFFDKKTGVMYLFYRYGAAGGLTVMVEEDGKPLIWEWN